MGGGHRRRRSHSRENAVDDAHSIVYYGGHSDEEDHRPETNPGGRDAGAGAGNRNRASKHGEAGGGGSSLLKWTTLSHSQASQMSQHAAAEGGGHHHAASNGGGSGNERRNQQRRQPSSPTRFLSRDERRKRSQLVRQEKRNEYSDTDDDDDTCSDDGKGGDAEGDGGVAPEEGSEDPFATIMGNDDSDAGEDDLDVDAEEEKKDDDDNNGSNDDEFGEDDDATDFPHPSPPTGTSPPLDGGHDDDGGNQPMYTTASRDGCDPSQRATAAHYSSGLHYDDYGDDDDGRGYTFGDDGGCGGIDMNALRRQSMKRSSSSKLARQSSSMMASTAGSRNISSKKRSRSSFAGSVLGGRMKMYDDDDLMSDLTNASEGNADMLNTARKAASKTGGSRRSSISNVKHSRSQKTSARPTDDSANAGVKKAKSSIVGSRPMHWGGSLGRKRSSSGVKQPQTESSASAKMAKKKLSDATRRSSADRLASASRRKSRIKDVAPKTPAATSGNGSAGGTATHTPKSKSSKSSATPGTASSSKWERHVNLREMEFAPAFISSRPSNANTGGGMGLSIQDDVVLTPNGRQPPSQSGGVTPVRFNLDGSNAGDGNMASSISATPCLSGKRSRKMSKAMGLSKLLRDVRSASDGDCMRLKSGASQAPRDLAKRRRMTDVSDPRNRAAYSIDVTLLGDSIPWEGGIKRTTILGYIHSTRVQKANDAIANGLPKAEAFAWIILDYDTVNEKRVARGTQLRIYDPTVIPSHEGLLSTIACTKVCEQYPIDLPPLSAVPKYDETIV